MTIVPRWEWRAFGDDAERRVAELEPERVQESDEVYLLAPGSDASVKIRDGLMDVKQLQRVDDDGLQQWLPVLKAPLPLSAADARLVLTALDVPVPELTRDAYSLDQLIGLSPDIHAVAVYKHRDHYTIGGAMAERTVLRTAAGETRTGAVESEHPDLVASTVRKLGFDPRANTSMARGLKALAGIGGQRFAVIDVGTNSVKFHIGERENGTWRTITDRAEVTRLGEGLDADGRLQPAPIARTVEAVAAMAAEARGAGAEKIAAVGTAGLRIAANASEFIDAVRARCGVEVEVISGEEESRLAYRATIAGLGSPAGDPVVFDTGGGSSQFTFADGERFSVNVGAAKYTERFGLDGAVTPETVAAARAAIAGDLARLDGREPPDAIIGMGGAVTNMAAVKHQLAEYDSDVVQGTVLDGDEIDRQIELYRTRPAADRRGIVGLQPNRAEVILAGACIVRTVLALLGGDALQVSDRGLRHGLLVERFG
jgi:exopolyphosphatase / guanosine-5'-triphosphate,3'-diphosphate pyrophosphatase